MTQMSDTVAQAAADHLQAHDPVLRPIIAAHGICPIRPNTDYYQELVDAIISQQLSVHAARSIEGRFRDLFGGQFPTPEQILTVDADTLRGIGFSRAKANYVHDLARHILAGSVEFDRFDSLSNEDIIAELTDVKGIGVWTAHMFLMFCMGRSDVLPVGDLGVRNAVRTLYGFSEPPTPDDITAVSVKHHWAPYESVASWYLWQSLNNAPKA